MVKFYRTFFVDLFHVLEGVDKFKIICRFFLKSNNLVGKSDLLGQGPSLPVGTMSQVRLRFFKAAQSDWYVNLLFELFGS